jgi:membrane-bound lytic murein transglycosylase B
MTAPRSRRAQPRRAQPSPLLALRWSSGVQRNLVLALLSAVAIGVPASSRLTSPLAAAQIPRAVMVATAPLPRSPAAEAPWAGIHVLGSLAVPSSSTVARLPSHRNDAAQASALASDGIPTTALLAYHNAAQRELTLDPKCGLSWPLLAGIGRVESDHGRFAGAVLHTDGLSTPRIIGIALDGNGTARILDTDHGRLDGDKVFDRAVGSMQFIPSTWARYRVDGNGDGVADPFNVIDAAAAAAHYLCAAGGDLTTLAGQQRAVRAYNNSAAYVVLVLRLEHAYARGVSGLTVPILPAGPTAPPQRSTMPPANPGPPLGLRKSGSNKPAPSVSTSTSHPASPSSRWCPAPTASASPSTSPSQSSTGAATDPTASPTDSSSAPVPTSTSPAGTGTSLTSGASPSC